MLGKSNHQLVADHSGKCLEVSNVSTTAGSLIHQWTCDPACALGTKRNQIWRLQGKSRHPGRRHLCTAGVPPRVVSAA
ncbi:RICIN domain-containing protein [Streptomyces melanogenes]|uniref:RICIN domain-containing protein n=1 Tax=Streptomyces melanogenes TaxID=67326 RepID=A0ABZ1XDJ3_9ACTN|nr:RICIN domain-containing protein [Streptomyces melanogenes]